jgi:cytochrome d ubiquinol oxidase subunit I
MKIATAVIIVASLLQLFTGHQSSRDIAKTQPAKLAAFEGHWETKPADMYIFGWVNQQQKTTSGLKIPGMLSFLVYNDVTKPVKGLKELNLYFTVNLTFQHIIFW